MALTKYTQDTSIIGQLGTRPEDRPGMTDQQLKDKFDENALNWKEFWNNTASEEIDALIAAIKGAGWTSESLKGLADLLSNLAGAGRTTETVKATADSIATHAAANGIDAHGTMPAVRVYHNAAQSVASSVGTNLAFNSERFDTNAMHDNVTNNTRLTAKTAGKYLVVGSVYWENNSIGIRGLSIVKNGAIIIAQAMQPAIDAYCSQTISTIINMSVNDYVELQAFQNSGISLNVTSTASYSPEFSMVKIA